MVNNPLSLTHRLKHYSRLYKQNHRVFCYRFIETFRFYYMDKIIDSCMKRNISSEMLHWGFYTTDIFLWLVRDFLDNIMDYSDEPVDYVMKCLDFDDIFFRFTNELKIQFLV